MRNFCTMIFVLNIATNAVHAQIKDPFGASTKVSPAKSAVKEAAKGVQDSKNSAGQAVNDTKLAAEIREQLLKHDKLKPLAISIDVQEGIAILKGKVQNNEQKNLAGVIAQKVVGVKSIQNKLDLEPKKK